MLDGAKRPAGDLPVRNLAQRYTVLTYTSLHPETLPKQASRAISSRGLRSFSVGTCYWSHRDLSQWRYWVVLLEWSSEVAPALVRRRGGVSPDPTRS